MFHALTHSLTHLLFHYLPPSFINSLSSVVTLSLSLSLPYYPALSSLTPLVIPPFFHFIILFTHYLTCSIIFSLTPSISHSLPHYFFTPSLFYTRLSNHSLITTTPGKNHGIATLRGCSPGFFTSSTLSEMIPSLFPLLDFEKRKKKNKTYAIH